MAVVVGVAVGVDDDVVPSSAQADSKAAIVSEAARLRRGYGIRIREV